MAGKSSWHITMPHFSHFESPKQMLEMANDYFTWAEDNPLYEDKAFAFQGTITHDKVAKMRVFTIVAMCNHMGITSNTWGNYRGYEDFKDIVKIIDKVIRDQKFTGATADLLNPMIISRDLGLAEKQIVESDNIHHNLNSDMSVEEMAEAFSKKLRDG